MLIEHANYQCQLWKKALESYSHLPHPIEHGWTDIDGSLTVQWGHLKPVPDSILEFVSCCCEKSKCATNYCSCVAVNLPCTQLCHCNNCKNNDSQERVHVNEIFNGDDRFGEYQDGETVEIKMMKQTTISRKLYLQQKLTTQQILIYLIGLLHSCIHSAGNIF